MSSSAKVGPEIQLSTGNVSCDMTVSCVVNVGINETTFPLPLPPTVPSRSRWDADEAASASARFLVPLSPKDTQKGRRRQRDRPFISASPLMSLCYEMSSEREKERQKEREGEGISTFIYFEREITAQKSYIRCISRKMSCL